MGDLREVLRVLFSSDGQQNSIKDSLGIYDGGSGGSLGAQKTQAKVIILCLAELKEFLEQDISGMFCVL